MCTVFLFKILESSLTRHFIYLTFCCWSKWKCKNNDNKFSGLSFTSIELDLAIIFFCSIRPYLQNCEGSMKVECWYSVFTYIQTKTDILHSLLICVSPDPQAAQPDQSILNKRDLILYTDPVPIKQMHMSHINDREKFSLTINY